MRRLKTIAGIIIVVLLMVLCMAAAGATAFEENIDAIDRAAQSVLMLMVYDKSGQYLCNGSGFVAFDNYTLVTNFHVMEGAAEIYATSDLGNQYLVTKVIAADEQKDIALLEFFSPTDLQPLTLEEQNLPRRAERVVTIGSPHGITNSVTTGNISAIFQDEDSAIIAFSAPISPGSSGGALLNNQGNVIGITSAARNDSQNINFAVDISEVIKLYKESKSTARVQFGDSVPSAKVTPTVALPAMPTPTPSSILSPAMTQYVNAVSDKTDIHVTWARAVGAKSYNIYRSSCLTDGYVFVGSAVDESYVDKNVKAGVYFYKVQSMGDEKSSDLSLNAAVVIYGYTEVSEQGVPRNIKARYAGKTITVTWSAVKNADSYLIYRSIRADGDYDIVAHVSGDGFIDTQMFFATSEYYCTVRSVRGTEISMLSSAAKTPRPKPTPKR